MKSRSLLTGALALLALSVLPATASATPAFSLRVEAPGETLDPGTLYAPRSPIGAPRGETPGGGNCVRSAGRIDLAGRNALGLIATASNANKELQPLWVVEDSFGRRVCRIAGFAETDTPSFTGWLYRVNHVAPPTSAELASVEKGDEVLWVFADFGSGANTGAELVLDAPVRATPGTLDVGVSAVTYDGVVNPAPDGTVVSGGSSPVTTVGGRAQVPVAAGDSVLRATGPGSAPTEIPSAGASLCVAGVLADCPSEPGRTLVGTNLRDSFKGGAGPDVVRTRGGRDKVRVRGGGSDVVDCGKGRDLVIADPSDELRRCEKVRGL
jgi:hypothetical protein